MLVQGDPRHLQVTGQIRRFQALHQAQCYLWCFYHLGLQRQLGWVPQGQRMATSSPTWQWCPQIWASLGLPMPENTGISEFCFHHYAGHRKLYCLTTKKEMKINSKCIVKYKFQAADNLVTANLWLGPSANYVQSYCWILAAEAEERMCAERVGFSRWQTCDYYKL